MFEVDEVDYALEIGEKVLNLSKKCRGKDSIRGFRSRAREFPQMMQQMDLIPSMTFLLSKIDDSILIPSIMYFSQAEENVTEKLCNEFKEEGYTSYLIVNFEWIKFKLQDIQFIDKCIKSSKSIEEIASDLLNSYIKNDLISVLKTLKDNVELLSEVEDSVLNLSIEIKKIVDGIYSGED
ncbi:type III-B CRISPR module-associated protein Cmr5 [Acidianus brierleyi]|uniref:CRISPR type III-B/RAMP module-associated protein Cmr5 n=1 Tax=Acidianus brierleyi TaxID=41673 RepID=A0A2U9IDC5_9CREN|nr:type III-B CRISPR module-associated protein Cmr5 [Acidianus brierleyi]